MGGWPDGWTDGCVDGWMAGWSDGLNENCVSYLMTKSRETTGTTVPVDLYLYHAMGYILASAAIF